MCGGKHPTESCPFKGLKSVSEHGVADSTHTTREEDVVKPKDIEKLKVLKLPENAGEFRGWLNSQIPQWNRFDRSSGDLLDKWLHKAMKAKTSDDLAYLRNHSDGLPRFDKTLAAFIMPEHDKRFVRLAFPKLRRRMSTCRCSTESTFSLGNGL
jgi:hypothetical protein